MQGNNFAMKITSYFEGLFVSFVKKMNCDVRTYPHGGARSGFQALIRETFPTYGVNLKRGP